MHTVPMPAVRFLPTEPPALSTAVCTAVEPADRGRRLLLEVLENRRREIRTSSPRGPPIPFPEHQHQNRKFTTVNKEKLEL